MFMGACTHEHGLPNIQWLSGIMKPEGWETSGLMALVIAHQCCSISLE
jgi:hypothetical protein